VCGRVWGMLLSRYKLAQKLKPRKRSGEEQLPVKAGKIRAGLFLGRKGKRGKRGGEWKKVSKGRASLLKSYILSKGSRKGRLSIT